LCNREIIHMPKFLKLIIVIIPIVSISTLLFISQQRLKSQQWFPVGNGILYGISGMSVVKQEGNSLDLLVVHDNKKPNQGRLGMVKIEGNNSPQYSPLEWQANSELPIDLEALAAFPNKALSSQKSSNNSSYMALSSSGKVYHFNLSAGNTISLIKTFDLPGLDKNNNLEAFALQEIGGKSIAIWAHRGGGEKPAIMYWGEFDLATYKVKILGSTTVITPLKSPNIRHISDLKVDSSGVTSITSAIDNGDDGPFESAVYIAGTFKVVDNKVVFQQNSPVTSIVNYDKYKIEAIDFLPNGNGGMVFATDDENMGSAILIKLK
jgi:hypothetical protein